jgi:hypothetical protein
MQVRCLLKRKISHQHQSTLDHVVHDIEEQGSALLARWAGTLPPILQQHASVNDVVLDSTDFGGGFSSSWDPTAKKSPKEADALFILGGRQSITGWLKLQGQSPMVTNLYSDKPLYANVLRKKQIFGKDLTMLVIHPFEDMPVQGSGWQSNVPVNLLRCPEAPWGKGGQPLAEFQPMKLASIAERIFHGLPW